MHALVICENPEVLAIHAAEAIVEIAREALSASGRFTLALSGGSTPRKTYRLLAQVERAAAIDWSKTFVFFSDERFVPTTDPRSNYRMAQEALLAHVPIPRSQVYPVPTAQISAGKAAEDYERELRKTMAVRSVDCEMTREASSPDNLPRKRTIFDLILLGLGADGHTASLFSRFGGAKGGERMGHVEHGGFLASAGRAHYVHLSAVECRPPYHVSGFRCRQGCDLAEGSRRKRKS